jgi:ribosomal protein S27E
MVKKLSKSERLVQEQMLAMLEWASGRAGQVAQDRKPRCHEGRGRAAGCPRRDRGVERDRVISAETRRYAAMSERIFDSQEVTVECPDCSHEITQTIGHFRASPKIECPGCGVTIKIEASSLDEALKSAEKSFADLKSKISRIKL